MENIGVISFDEWRLWAEIGSTQLKPQSHQAYDQVTTYLRPKNGALVEGTYDWSQRSYDWSQRSWVIARGKSVAVRSWSCSKPSHTGLTTRLRPTCDRKYCHRGQIEERTYDWSHRVYDWSQRSWVIARGKSVATRSMVMFKTWNQLFQIVSGRTISRATGRATLRPVAPPIDCSRRIPRLIVRSIGGGHDWSYDRSFMATTSRTISYDMMDLVIDLLQSVLIVRPRVRPFVRWPTTSEKDRSQYATRFWRS